jgi:transcriptional regulator with XRE-family HTH domain
MNFAERLKELRLRDGMSQAELAKKIGRTNAAISMYETGRREPDLETLEELCDLFNVNMNYLTGQEDGSTYYLDPKTAQIAQELYNRPELRVLFDASRKVSAEDLKIVQAMIDRMAKQDDNDQH